MAVDADARVSGAVMLQKHLRRWADSLDEDGFRVRIASGADRAANRAFDDGQPDDASLDRVTQQALDVRLRAAGLQPAAGMRVLDVCAGRGHLGELLSHKYRARVTSADLSLTQLTELLRRADRDRWHASACAADLLALPYEDGAFDLVAGHSFLHHLPNVPGALAEMFRVVRPGGLVALLHEPNLNADYWGSFPLSLLKDTEPQDGFTDLWKFRPDDLRRLCEDAGFADVRVHGSGLLSAVVLNWSLIALVKLKAGTTWAAKAAYRLRLRLNGLELRWRRGRYVDTAPSLMLVARRPDRRAA
jgi:ubiquinone/menaquinone biosynthesis C-methylase UbiE